MSLDSAIVPGLEGIGGFQAAARGERRFGE